MTEKLKQRLVGAVVLVSLAVIFIPMLLDGGERSTMPMFGSNIPDKPDYQFEPLEIPLQPVPPITEERPVLIDKPEPAPEPKSEPEREHKASPIEPKAAVETPAPDVKTSAEAGAITAWVVQVGSFAQSGNALTLRDKLRSNGFTAYVEKVKTNGDIIFRVRVGPEIKRENAEKQLKRLKRVMMLDGIIMEHGA